VAVAKGGERQVGHGSSVRRRASSVEVGAIELLRKVCYVSSVRAVWRRGAFYSARADSA